MKTSAITNYNNITPLKSYYFSFKSAKITSFQTKNIFKIDKLLNSYNSNYQSLEDAALKQSDPILFLTGKIDDIICPLVLALNNKFIVHIFNADKKFAGGYLMSIDKKKKRGCVEILTLESEYRNTKVGNNILKEVADSIHKHSLDKELDVISWKVERSEKGLRKLYSRFSPKTIGLRDGFDLQIVSVDYFKRVIDNYKKIEIK